MKLAEFPEQTVVVAKDQPEYLPLPAHKLPSDPDGKLTCCWELNWKERFHLLLTGKIWHQVLTFNNPLQPQRLTVEKPILNP